MWKVRSEWHASLSPACELGELLITDDDDLGEFLITNDYDLGELLITHESLEDLRPTRSRAARRTFPRDI